MGKSVDSVPDEMDVKLLTVLHFALDLTRLISNIWTFVIFLQILGEPGVSVNINPLWLIFSKWQFSLSITASLVPNIGCWFHCEVPEVAVVIRKLPPERLDSNGPFHKGFPVLNYNLPGGPSIRADPNELTLHTHLFGSLNKSPGRLMSVSRYGH